MNKDLGVPAGAGPLPSRHDELLQLRDQLRAATGPDRELDADIFQFIVGGKAWDRQYWNSKAIMPRGYTEEAVTARTRVKAPAYTTSIDAAVALRPPHNCWMIEESGDAAWVWLKYPVRFVRAEDKARGATMSLALCRARVEYELAKATESPADARDRRGSERSSRVARHNPPQENDHG